MAHSKLLSKAENKYELVLEVARRAKIIKDEIAKTEQADTMKPIPWAIKDMMYEDEHGIQPKSMPELAALKETTETRAPEVAEVPAVKAEGEDTEETEAE